MMLSVSGLRGIIGRSLTPPLAAKYTAAFGLWLKEANNTDAPTVVLGRDSRPSGQMIENAAAAGLTAVGCRVIRIGIVTTPGVAIMTEHLHAHGGMVITASHNPIIWNGIKALRHDGVAPPAEQAQSIIQRFKDDDIQYAPVQNLLPTEEDHSAHNVHLSRILPHVDVDAIRKRAPKVVLDSVNGAGGPATAMLLEQLGADLIHLYPEPTGLFPHTPEPQKQNLTTLCDAVREHHADVGFAQDPDADRLAIVDENGNYIGEEYTLALAAMHALNRPDRPEKPVIAANLSTSRMVNDIAAQHNATVIRTAVGEANVANAMRQHNALIGGEGNGGIIWPKVVHVRDSLAGIALVLEMLANTGQPLSAAVAKIPAYAIVKDKFDVQPGQTQTYTDKVQHKYADQNVDNQDGVRVDWPDRWVHIRPSNTEPILRIIAEAADESAAHALINDVRQTAGL